MSSGEAEIRHYIQVNGASTRCLVPGCEVTVHGALGEIRCRVHGGPDLPASVTDVYGHTVYLPREEK